MEFCLSLGSPKAETEMRVWVLVEKVQEAGVREQETRKEGEPTSGVTELVIAAGSGALSCQTPSEALYQERLRIVSLKDAGGIHSPTPISRWSIPLAL